MLRALVLCEDGRRNGLRAVARVEIPTPGSFATWGSRNGLRAVARVEMSYVVFGRSMGVATAFEPLRGWKSWKVSWPIFLLVPQRPRRRHQYRIHRLWMIKPMTASFGFPNRRLYAGANPALSHYKKAWLARFVAADSVSAGRAAVRSYPLGPVVGGCRASAGPVAPVPRAVWCRPA